MVWALVWGIQGVGRLARLHAVGSCGGSPGTIFWSSSSCFQVSTVQDECLGFRGGFPKQDSGAWLRAPRMFEVQVGSMSSGEYDARQHRVDYLYPTFGYGISMRGTYSDGLGRPKNSDQAPCSEACCVVRL